MYSLPTQKTFILKAQKKMQSFLKSSQISDDADVIEFNNDLKTLWDKHTNALCNVHDHDFMAHTLWPGQKVFLSPGGFSHF